MRNLVVPAALSFLALGFWNMLLQMEDSRETERIAADVVLAAGAVTPEEKVLAIRDYLRSHIRFEEALMEGRPFFRASASETLRSERGYCGEVSRTFICMAESMGVRAQRINLYGRKEHVVAEADLGSKGLVVVDCQSPPSVADLQPLGEVTRGPDYYEYSTLNLRRVHLDRAISRIKLPMGGVFTYFLERPYALRASLWAGLAFGLIALQFLRYLLRKILVWRGWKYHVIALTKRRTAPSFNAPLARILRMCWPRKPKSPVIGLEHGASLRDTLLKSSPGKGPRVLVVDDEKPMRALLCLMLADQGMQTLEAADGELALQLLEQQPVDLLLLDVCLPGQDGFAVMREAKRLDHGLPVILITGLANIPDAVRALKRGAESYLAKPFDGNQLIDAITAPLEHRLAQRMKGAEEVPAIADGIAHNAQCPSCHAEDSRFSERRGIEPLLAPLLLRPYRCNNCSYRFWKWGCGAWLNQLIRAMFHVLFEHRWTK